MKEFIEKLIGRLEEKRYKAEMWSDSDDDYFSGKEYAYDDSMIIINQLAEEYTDKDCSKCSRRSWYQKGYADAEKKLAEEYSQDLDKDSQGWIPCSERLPEEATVYEVTEEIFINSKKQYIVEHRLFVTEGEWLCPSNRKVLAWQPLPVPYTKNKVSEMPTDWKQSVMEKFERVE